MEVIKPGEVPPRKTRPEPKIAGVYTCYQCKCQVKLEQSDKHLVKTGQSYEDGPYLYIECPTDNCPVKEIVVKGAGQLFWEWYEEAHPKPKSWWAKFFDWWK